MTHKCIILLIIISSIVVIIFTIYDRKLALGSSSDVIVRKEQCDVFLGEWVQNDDVSYYTNKTCWAIHEHQNCMKYGRPDFDYLKWKWQPDRCNLPVFEPVEFLETFRNKSLAFVGDSVGRNQMQSLICLLSRVEYPTDESYTKDENFKRLKYATYNFTLASFWTTHLARSKEIDPIGPTNNGLFNLYLDEYDENWVNNVKDFDYIIISSGHWFFRPMIFYEHNNVIGCNSCMQSNITELPIHYAYRKVFKTAFKAINTMKNFKGITFLRTFAPSHFEGGAWNEGGKCIRTIPFLRNETRLTNDHRKMYLSQIEEFEKARREGEKRGVKFRVLDVTLASLLRPDGHPGIYGHWRYERVKLYNDCVHWCLPGPIDTWNVLLLEMVKREM